MKATTRRGRGRWTAVLAAAALLGPACNDPIRMLGVDNRPALANAVDSFRYQAFDLDNVHDTLRWTWMNTGTQAAVMHASFIPHGDTLLSIRNPDGVEVYHGPLLTPEGEPLEHDTRPGPPGAWTIELNLYGVDGGRIDFSVVRKEAGSS
jgi:hypothetical protein